jgi:hypothetical protein
MNDAKLLEAVRMLQDATKLLDAILVEQIGTHNVISTAPRIEYDALNKVTGWKPKQVLTEQPDYNLSNVTQPDYDVSNVAPAFQIGDKVEVNGVGLRGTVTGMYGTDEYFVKMGHDTSIYSGRVLVKVA